MDERMVAAIEKIAEELRQIRINSSVIAHALSGETESGERTVAQSLTRIGKSLRSAAENSESTSLSLSGIEAQVKGIADAMGEVDIRTGTVSVLDALNTLASEAEARG